MVNKKKVLVRGPALTESGYGEHARFVLRSLKNREDVDLYLVLTNWGKTSWLSRDDEERQWIDGLFGKTIAYQRRGGQFDVSIQVTIPGEWEKMAPINIGVTAGMETDKVSQQWIEKTYVVDKIVVTSEHSRDSFKNAFYIVRDPRTGSEIELRSNPSAPIEVAHYPVIIHEKCSDFQLDLKHDFNYLAVLQWGPRKNLEQTIQGFFEAMANESVGLILKISGANNSNVDREDTKDRLDVFLRQLYKKYPDHKCSVHLLHGYLENDELSSLYQFSKIKSLIAIPHGEGFGLPIFEAAYYGLPIICTLWSGHVDFLSAPTVDKSLHKTVIKPMVTEVEYEIDPVGPEFRDPQWKNVIEPGMKWCYPDMASYKKALVEMYKSHSEKLGKAKKLQKHVLVEFEASKMLAKMSDVLLGETIKSEVEIGVV